MPPGSPSQPTSRQDEVLRELKACGPLPVRDLAPKLQLNYMGAKNHCLALENEGSSRDDEGRFTELVPGVRIIERRNPSAALHKAFPEADSLEESLFRQVLGVPVRRRLHPVGAQYEIHLDLHTPLAAKEDA